MAKLSHDGRAKRRTIRGKLIALVAGSVGVSVLLVSGVSTMRDARRDAARQAEHMQAVARVLASASAAPLAADERARAFAAIRTIGETGDITYAGIERADGSLFAETGAGVRLAGDAQVGEDARAGLWSLVGSHTLEASAPVKFRGQTLGRVVLLGKAEGVAGRLAFSLLVSLGSALVAMGLGLLVALRLQRSVSGPVIALTRAMGEVREQHAFDRRVEIESDDEVGDLVDGFNAMLGEIRARDARLAEHMAGLERTVAERTADLAAAKDVAEQANAAKSDFLATMSHEIRTPMNGVMVMAEMLAAGDLAPRQRRFAEVIAKSGASLLAIINDILDLSKIEAGKMELEAVPLDPAEVVEDVLALFWERAAGKGLDLAAYVDPAVPAKVMGDPTRLRQVIGNLVNNAIKFTEAGGVLVRVEMRRGAVRFAVEDTGVGIAEDKLDHVFAAFSQADQSTTRKFGGTGLGLAICKKLVEAMDGRLSVTSRLGEGSVFAVEAPLTGVEPAEPWPILDDGAVLAMPPGPTRQALALYLGAPGDSPALTVGVAEGFAGSDAAGARLCLGGFGDDAPARLKREGKVDAILALPLRRDDLRRVIAAVRAGADLSALSEAQAGGAADLPSFAGARVLVADDSPVNREVATEALARLGVVPALVEDGQAAVEAAQEQAFDLILMDGSMPRLDGYDAARAIRAAEGEARRTPIVALTAHVVGTAAEAWRDSGMDGVLHKPFTLAALAEVLGRFLTPAEPNATVTAPMAADAPPALSADLFDPTVVAELEAMAAGGRAEFVERIRKLYRANAPQALEALHGAHMAGAAEDAARGAHALKSMSLNLGARKVSTLAAGIEAAGREGRIDGAAVRDLAVALHATLSALAGATAAPALSEDDRLIADLRAGIPRGELHLVYQKQMDRDGQALIGVETLVRWTHPERGPIGPALFIPLAEERGVIGEVTNWVIDQAMAEMAPLAPLSVAINVSPGEFADPGLVDRLQAAAARHDFDLRRLVVEITETAILNDGAEVQASMARLKALGVCIALDDFGAGYSSLSHLRLFPFDKLKIEKQFIDGCGATHESAAIVHAVISIGRALGMKVVAEGIETEAQRRFLKTAGAHALQGYLWGKPARVAQIAADMAAPPLRAAG